MIFLDQPYLFLAWYTGSIVVFSYRRYPTTIVLGFGPLEITFPRWGHRLTRWRDVKGITT